MDFWSRVARIILRNRWLFILLILANTVYMATQWKNVGISYTQKSILPDNHPDVIQYKKFKKEFPNDNSTILIGLKDSLLFTANKLNKWNKLAKEISSFKEVEGVLAIGNLKVLKKDTLHKKFVFEKLVAGEIKSDVKAQQLKTKIFDSLPFYEGIVYNKKTGAVQTIISLKKEVVDSKKRAEFITKKLVPLLEKYTSDFPQMHESGLIFVKTLDAEIIKKEIPLFIGLTLLVAALLLFFFFRSFSPMLISLFIVSIAVMWTFGFMGLFNFQISILTAIIPPLVIVIGVPNAIFLINKYQQEIILHGNQAKSLQRVISKTGNAILMTNLTTAIGFATFIIVNNKLLKEFGIIASLSVFSIFILSLLMIPIIYSFKKIPKSKHLAHLNKKWTNKFINWLINTVRYKYQYIFGMVLLLVIISMIGIYKINISGSILADLPRNTKFYRDIKFFEQEFGGILPLEIMIDTKRKKGVFKPKNLKKADELQQAIEEIPELSRPVSVVNLVKYIKQAFYNNDPKYYQLPSRNERAFIMSYLKKDKKGENNILKSYTDSLQRYMRITSFMKDIETDRMEKVEDYLAMKSNKLFPKDKYEVIVTGKAKLFLKGTHYLIDNLAVSLSLAILLIFIFIAWMFRWSWKMAIISVIPNLLPLMITAGLMGFLKIPLKPSTILIFSIAFGISVDDTIHYLAKLRQELRHHQGKVRRSVYKALRETGLSMFYTSIVLFFGFLVFLGSSYGGTKALGGLISFTLLVAMFSNLLLLPALVLFLDKYFKNKEDYQAPELVIFPEDDEDKNDNR